MRYITLLIALIINLSSGFGQNLSEAELDSAVQKGDKIISRSDKIFFRNVESLIVYSHGGIQFEKYYNGFSKDSMHQIQSQTKSIVALLMGIAIDKGFVKSENEPVSRYFPEYFNKSDDLKSTVTIRDLLTMSAGFEWDEMIAMNDPKNDNMNMFRSGNWLNYALTKSMAKKPFSEFNYCSGLPMIVAGIIEKSTKMKLDEFAGKYLFEPIGIKQYRWLKDNTGFCHAGGGLYLKPVDMLKIGILVLNNGKWQNQQIISGSWIQKSTTAYLPTSYDIARYGYYWWIRDMKKSDGKTAKVISAEGAGGQKLFIFPEYNLIIAFTERNYTTPQVSPIFIQESILPILN